MIAKLKEIVIGKPAEKTVRVKMERAARLRVASGELLDGAPGEHYDVAPRDADDLVSAGAATIVPSKEDAAEREARKKEIAALIPGPIEPQPVPDHFADLPESFADWWTLREKRRTLGERSVKIMEKFRREWLFLDGDDSKIDNINLIPDLDARKEVIGTLMAARVRIIENDPRRFERIQRLQDALYRSWQALDDFDEMNRDELWRAKIKSGDQVVEQHGRATRLCRESSALGLAIYRTRIAALSLDDAGVRRLYGESTDALRFEHRPPTLSGQRVAWSDEDGTRTYLDKNIGACATYYRQFKAMADELEKLIKAGKAELKRAESVKPEKLALT